MPYARGSAGAIDAIVKALLVRGGVHPGAWREGLAVDLEAFFMTKDEFVHGYPTFFER